MISWNLVSASAGAFSIELYLYKRKVTVGELNVGCLALLILPLPGSFSYLCSCRNDEQRRRQTTMTGGVERAATTRTISNFDEPFPPSHPFTHAPCHTFTFSPFHVFSKFHPYTFSPFHLAKCHQQKLPRSHYRGRRQRR